MNRKLHLIAAPLLLLLATGGAARTLSAGPPEQAGYSAERLGRIDRLLQGAVEAEEVAGASALVVRDGRIAYAATFGLADREASRPMASDTLFRIASMTKAVTTVAVMMLFEEGRFLLDDPVARFITEFGDMTVLVPAADGAEERREPAARPITIRHLLTHTSGITYGFYGQAPFAEMYRAAGVSDGLRQTEGTIGEMVRKLAALPLVSHPGERFQYGLNTDVLGYLVEVVSGMPLDAFFRERIFMPLGMSDTGFRIGASDLARLAAVYRPRDGGGLERYGEELITMGPVRFSTSYHYRGPDRYFSGGAGLVSTIGDYARLLEMLLNGGALDGKRLLGPKTVELMTVNQIGELDFGDGGSRLGLGFNIHRGPAYSGDIGSAGEYAWGGFFYTRFWVDPEQRLIGVLMTQRFPNTGYDLHERFRVAVYQALIDLR